MQYEHVNSSLLKTLDLPQINSFALLQRFLGSGDFEGRMQIAFGSSIDATLAATFIGDIISGREFLQIAVVESDEINRAYGAFDQTSGTIFLSKDFLLTNSDEPSKVSAVLLEEIG